MSAPENAAPAAPVPLCELVWTDNDWDAVLAALEWFSTATRERLAPYAGMHVAVMAEGIVEADRDFDALARRLDADPARYPLTRMVLRYIPTAEEAIRYRF